MKATVETHPGQAYNDTKSGSHCEDTELHLLLAAVSKEHLPFETWSTLFSLYKSDSGILAYVCRLELKNFPASYFVEIAPLKFVDRNIFSCLI